MLVYAIIELFLKTLFDSFVMLAFIFDQAVHKQCYNNIDGPTCSFNLWIFIVARAIFTL